MIYKICIPLVLCVSVSLFAMDKRDIKVPSKNKTPKKINKILEHAGCQNNEHKKVALNHVFERMRNEPHAAPRRQKQAMLLEDGVHTHEDFNNLKNLWHEYRQSSKQTQKNVDSQILEDSCDQVQENCESQDEKVKAMAQDIVNAALDLYAQEAKAQIRNQMRQKYIAIFVGTTTTILSFLLTAYFSRQCPENSGS